MIISLCSSAESSLLLTPLREEGAISTPQGERSIRSLRPNSKCAFTAFAVFFVAGAVLMALGAAEVFGPVGSQGFIGSLVGGAASTVFATGCLIMAFESYQAGQRESPISPTATGDATVIASTRNATDPRQSYSPVGQAALDFARQKLRENPHIEAAVFSSVFLKTHQPVNREIALLETLWNEYKDAFEEKIKNHSDPWFQQQEVIQAADNLIKIGYAISCLTLEDLPEFTSETTNLWENGAQRTYGEALSMVDSYQVYTYFYCTRAYHYIRCGRMWWRRPDGVQELVNPIWTRPGHSELFYHQGTIQSSWRALYNDYCDRVRLYVNERDLPSEYDNWIQHDEGPDTFRHTPDTLPY